MFVRSARESGARNIGSRSVWLPVQDGEAGEAIAAARIHNANTELANSY